MNDFLGIAIAWLMILASLSSSMAELTGEVCSEMRPVHKSRSEFRPKNIQQYYTTSCGLFNLDRCKRNRVLYKNEKVITTWTIYEKHYRCCPGWQTDPANPTSCSIHGKPPVVMSCLERQVVQRFSGNDFVTWAAPIFRAAYEEDIAVTSPYSRNTGILHWGNNRMRYTATSNNNGMTVDCNINVIVQPFQTTADIMGYTLGQMISHTAGDTLTLTCKALYGVTKPELVWTLDGNTTDFSTTNTSSPSDYEGRWDSVSTIRIDVSNTHNSARIECKLKDAIAGFWVNLNATYEVRPTVTHCPGDIVVESSIQKASVTWDVARFVDPRWNEEVDVYCNYGNHNSKDFQWGEHTIVYIGTNKRNGLSAQCRFDIVVKPKQCTRKPIMPQNGGLVCGYWKAHYVQACFRVCANSKGLLWSGEYSQLFTCGANGEWSPKPEGIDCVSAIKKNENSGTVQDQHNFFGKCSASVINNVQQTALVRKMLDSEFNNRCGTVEGDNRVTVDVLCP